MGAGQAELADPSLRCLKFVRADPELDRYCLRVAHAVVADATWWIWQPEDDQAILSLARELTEQWRLVLEDVLGLTMEPPVIHVVLAQGDYLPTLQFGAREWPGFVDRIRWLFLPGTVPGDNCVIEYGPSATRRESFDVYERPAAVDREPETKG